MKLIERKNYLQKLIDIIGTHDIKVITGIRRCGKSKLLIMFSNYIKANDPNANVIEINLQLKKFEDLLDKDNMYTYISNSYISSKKNYLFIDEVQLCKGFELIINSLHEEEKYDIYITGSNAFLLSSDLVTLFTGRTFQIHIYPFSFKEMVEYYQYENNLEKAFKEYLEFGGFAGSYEYKNIEDKYKYISDEVYLPILTRDIVQKYNIKYQDMIKNISLFMIDNIANLISPNSITNFLSRNDNKTTNKTTVNYINHMANAYLFYEAKRFDLKGKKYLSTDSKFYLADHAIKYSQTGTRNLDYGRIYENIVYIELLRRGYEVYIGKLYQKEIDFIAIKRSEKIYIQVSSFIEDKKTLEREISPLLMIKDAYPKMIIARTHYPAYDEEGIKIIDIVDWLYNY